MGDGGGLDDWFLAVLADCVVRFVVEGAECRECGYVFVIELGYDRTGGFGG